MQKKLGDEFIKLFDMYRLKVFTIVRHFLIDHLYIIQYVLHENANRKLPNKQIRQLYKRRIGIVSIVTELFNKMFTDLFDEKMLEISDKFFCPCCVGLICRIFCNIIIFNILYCVP